MKALIVYSSQTGNTEKLAEAIKKQLTCEIEVFAINEAPEPDGYDLVFLGFWLQAGKPDPKSAEYLTKIGKTKLFLFATHGAATGSTHAANAMASAISLAPSAEIVGTFSCQGEVSQNFLDKARLKNPPPPWIEDAKTANGHPDSYDIGFLVEVLQDKVTGCVK